MSMLPFASSSDGPGINEPLLREYAVFLANKAEGTIEAYLRTARQVMIWAASRPGNGGVFQPQHLTKTVVEMYLACLADESGYVVEVASSADSCRPPAGSAPPGQGFGFSIQQQVNR